MFCSFTSVVLLCARDTVNPCFDVVYPFILSVTKMHNFSTYYHNLPDEFPEETISILTVVKIDTCSTRLNANNLQLYKLLVSVIFSSAVSDKYCCGNSFNSLVMF